MPEITFILPHWVYWGGIFLIPLTFMWAVRRFPPRTKTADLSIGLAYFFLVVGGLFGVHRLYIKSFWAGAFIVLFAAILFCNNEARQARNAHSIVRNDASIAQYDLERAREDMEDAEVIADLSAALEAATAQESVAAQTLDGWRNAARNMVIALALLLALDAFLLPHALRQARRRRHAANAPPPQHMSSPSSARESDGKDAFSRGVSALNRTLGEFVSYWTLIAVFVFYYEVIARYVFNSPTIWAHESMYLLFGMQYLLAGGFCLREKAHVRVDVLYMHLSARTRAITDLITSVFFFIFTVALAVTGWIFFHDAYVIREVSFTEWAIPYFPIKFALPLGGALIILQGVAQLLGNIDVLRTTAATR